MDQNPYQSPAEVETRTISRDPFVQWGILLGVILAVGLGLLGKQLEQYESTAVAVTPVIRLGFIAFVVGFGLAILRGGYIFFQSFSRWND